MVTARRDAVRNVESFQHFPNSFDGLNALTQHLVAPAAIRVERAGGDRASRELGNDLHAIGERQPQKLLVHLCGRQIDAELPEKLVENLVDDALAIDDYAVAVEYDQVEAFGHGNLRR